MSVERRQGVQRDRTMNRYVSESRTNRDIEDRDIRETDRQTQTLRRTTQIER